MVQVEVNTNRIYMKGHAERSQNGQDIVCAAISALTCNLINSLQSLSHDIIHAKTSSGETIIEWQHLSDKGRLLVDSWFLGLVAINQEYNCIQFVQNVKTLKALGACRGETEV